jgi:hypothetical protein
MSRGREWGAGRIRGKGREPRIRRRSRTIGEGNENRHDARPLQLFTHPLRNELARIRRLSRLRRRRRTVTRGRSRTRERLRSSGDSANPNTSRRRGRTDVPVDLIAPCTVSRRRRYQRRQRCRRQGCHGCGGRRSLLAPRATTCLAACCRGALDPRCEHACGGWIC